MLSTPSPPPPHSGAIPGSHANSLDSGHGCWAHGCTSLDFILIWSSTVETQLHQPSLYPPQTPTQASTAKGNRTVQRPLGLGEDPPKDRIGPPAPEIAPIPSQLLRPWAYGHTPCCLPMSTNPLLPCLLKSPLPPASPR